MEIAKEQLGITMGPPGYAKDEERTSDLTAFIGFCAFSIALQLYDNFALMTSTNMFNGSLYASVSQVLVFVLCAIAGFISSVSPPRLLAPIAGVVAAGCAAFELFTPFVLPCGPCCVLLGCSIAILSLCWGFYLGKRPSYDLCLRITAALFLGSAVTFVLFAADAPLTGEVVLVVAFAASGAPWLMKKTGVDGGVFCSTHDGGNGVDSKVRTGQTEPVETPRFSVSATALITLAVCCLLSAFFTGVTINPYGIQSKSIDAYMHLITTASFGLLAISCIVFKVVNLQAFTLAALATLMVGLLMMSTGLVGSVVVPIGLILAMRSLSWGLAWVAIAALGQANPAKWMAICSLGLLASNGALGRGVGMLLANGTSISFGDLTISGVACITAIAVAYAVMNSTRLALARVPVGYGLNGRKSLPEIADMDDDGVATTGPGAGSARTGDADSGFGIGGVGTAGTASVVANVAGSPDTSLSDGVPSAIEPEAAVSDGLAAEAQATLPDSSVVIDEQLLFADLDLTEKEINVAHLLAMNAPYVDIASQLGLSVSTVKFHAKHIFEKAGVNTKREFFLKYSSLDKAR